MNLKTRSLLLATLASALALPLAAEENAAQKSSQFKDSEYQCWGINACKGQGSCSATGRREDGCSGSNECRRKGFLRLDPETCLKVEGGRLTKTAEKKPHAHKEQKKS